MIRDFCAVQPLGVPAKQLAGQYGEVVFATRAGAPAGVAPFAIKAQGFCGEKKDIATSLRRPEGGGCGRQAVVLQRGPPAPHLPRGGAAALPVLALLWPPAAPPNRDAAHGARAPAPRKE